jgi:hypothetical protein
MVVDTIKDVAGSILGPINDLRRSIEAAGDKLQKGSLALGKDFSQMSAEITPAMENLQGSLDQRTQAALLSLNAGLQGNTLGVQKLINQQQLTGSQFAATAKTLAELGATMDLSNEEINSLSKNLIDTGGHFTVSTDKLVNALVGLKDTFPTQALAGMGSQVNEAMVSLTARMPAMGEQVGKVMRMILDPSLKTEANLARLGIAGVRERLAAATTTKQAEQILIGAIKTSSSVIEDFVSGDFFASIGIAKSAFGETAPLLVAMNKQLEKRIVNEEKVSDFGKTLEAMRAGIFVPLQEVIRRKLFPALLELNEVFADIGTIASKHLANFIDSLDISEDGLVKVKNTMIDFAISLVGFAQSLSNGFGSLVNFTLPLLAASIEGVAKMAMKFGFIDLTTRDLIPAGQRAEFDRLTALKNMPTLTEIAASIPGMAMPDEDDTIQKRADARVQLQAMEEAAMDAFGTVQTPNLVIPQFVDRVTQELQGLKTVFEKGPNNGEGTDADIRTADAVTEMNQREKDIFNEPTGSDALTRSATQIQSALAGILGVDPVDTQEEVVDLLTRIANNQTLGPTGPRVLISTGD